MEIKLRFVHNKHELAGDIVKYYIYTPRLKIHYVVVIVYCLDTFLSTQPSKCRKTNSDLKR